MNAIETAAWRPVQHKYKILQLLGHGSFGMVMLAKCLSTKQKVAIKLITDAYKSTYNFKKVMREIQIMKQLTKMKNNIYTTKFLDLIVDEESVFIIMDYGSKDLLNLFKSSKGPDFSLKEDSHLIIILYNLLCALNFLHSANITHRDIKPNNFLLDNDCKVCICDFGMARTFESKDGKKRSKSPYVISRWYRAPEVILGD